MPNVIPSTYFKQPNEREYISIDFTDRLTTGDSISSILLCKCYYCSADVTSSMVENPGISDVGKTVTMWIKDGEDGKLYNLTVRVNTVMNFIIEADLKIDVREIFHCKA